MPWRRANDSALPGVGDATAATSISSGIIFTDAAMQSAWKREPTIPIFTFDTSWSPVGDGHGNGNGFDRIEGMHGIKADECSGMRDVPGPPSAFIPCIPSILSKPL